ncbi:hypothetical protein CPLU01_13685 [Colletotrichum plurivorum]|uniref:Uncharacterized protein n=1 Tax=Colletotrichum plurivorum TaxID=2175906 RepID=A0A8H6JPN4_9PEZI|nr:hypothetical protein CPLU01_13685 [Colletotrichum plurivorum]
MLRAGKGSGAAEDGTEFLFVAPVTHISQIKKPRNQQVRSHAAKNPTARRQRVTQYQRNHHSYHTHQIQIRPQPRQDSIDPFDTFVTPLAPNEDKLIKVFLKHAALKNVFFVPTLDVVDVNDENKFWHTITSSYVTTAKYDKGMLANTLLVACRYMAECMPDWKERFTAKALHYKDESVRQLSNGEAPADPSLKIIKLLAIASEEHWRNSIFDLLQLSLGLRLVFQKQHARKRYQ